MAVSCQLNKVYSGYILSVCSCGVCEIPQGKKHELKDKFYYQENVRLF